MMKKAISETPKTIEELHQRTREIQEENRIKEEEWLANGVIYLPTWREDKRASPNSFLRSALFAAIHSKDRLDFKKAEIFSQQGVTITYTGEQLNQEDLTVWLVLVDLMKKDPLGTKCKFSAHKILKHMGLEIGGTGYERLNNSLIRMMACVIAIKTEKYIFFDSLIQRFEVNTTTNEHQYGVELNRRFIKLFGQNDWTAIDWEQRKQLRNKPLCLKLHDYYSSHEKPLSVSLEFLLNITGSTNSQKASFKRQVKTALEELVRIDFLKSYSIEQDMVTVERLKNSTK